ncbi:hypothetical protein BKA70DRAFT_1307466 [Coprinopsis sp. MPI-PUGE-AT-0042]|nr:hypothetical protein BKA70DRAFT_1307466 [Coprinopsis sp. MPI-PUGE-AT-0042]
MSAIISKYPASVGAQKYILDIPPEIISQILRGLFNIWAGKEERGALRTASMVSRTWRAISLGTPELWAGLSFEYTRSSVHKTPQILSRWFDRAGESLPLDLELKGYYSDLGEFKADEAVSKIITWTSEKGPRWRCLRTPFPLHLLFLEVNPPRWTNLRVLSARRRPIRNPPPLYQNAWSYYPATNSEDTGRNIAACDQIQDLEIVEHRLFSSPLATLFPNVSVLQIHYEIPSNPPAHALELSKFRHLTHLNFVGSTNFTRPTYANAHPSVLHHLESLELRIMGHADNSLLAYLTCPTLFRLTLSMGNPWRDGNPFGQRSTREDEADTKLLNVVTSFRDRSAMTLKQLSLTGFGVGDFVFKKLIETNPSVQAVELDRWPYLEVTEEFKNLLPHATRISIVPHTVEDDVQGRTEHKRNSFLSFLSQKAGSEDTRGLTDEKLYPGAGKVVDHLLQVREAPRVKMRLGEDREWELA